MSAELSSLLSIGVTIRPLERPVGSAYRVSPFGAKWSTTRAELHRELVKHGAQMATLEVDLLPPDFRQDGAPRGDRQTPRSAGVRLSFRATAIEGAPVLVFDAGEFSPWSDNVRALALGLESLRRADRYGITKRGEQYRGFLALPSGAVDVDHGHRLISRLGRAGALRATHPDTREDGYTDSDHLAVKAAAGIA